MADPVKARFGIKETPTFSSSENKDVHAYEDYTIKKHIDATSMIVDATTLVVDAVNHRVGIGTKTPNSQLDIIQSNVDTSMFRLYRSGNYIEFMSPSGTPARVNVRANGTTNCIIYYLTTSGEFGVGDCLISSTIFTDSSRTAVKIASSPSTAPVASAQLEIESTSKGFLPPRMTTAQKDAISSPATGLVVYDTTLNKVCIYNGTAWVTMHAGDNYAKRTLTFVIDGGGSTITTGAKKAYIQVPFACTITGYTVLADQSGSIVLDLWKDTYANYPPTVADTITASAKPTISSATKTTSTTLTGWTTSIAADDILEVNVDSVTTLTKVTLFLYVSVTP